MNEVPPVPARIRRLHLHERDRVIGVSVREADRRVMAAMPKGAVLDTTHFDTVRFPPPPWASPLAAAAAGDGRTAYTVYRGDPGTRAAVAEPVSELVGFPVDPDREMALTPGTQGGVFASLAALADEGAAVAVMDPDYLFTQRTVRFLGGEVEAVPLAATSDGAQPHFGALEAALAGGARVLIFSHPNNPTGAVYAPATLERIAQLLVRYDAYAIVDELYARLVYAPTPFASLAGRPGMRERCITLLGPSKTESLTGYRVGVVVGPPWAIDRIEDVIAMASLRAPAYGQQVLRGWLSRDRGWVASRVEELRALRDMTVERLSGIVPVTPQQGTAYLFPDVSALGVSDQELAMRLLRDAKVLVSPGYQFGARGLGHFRVCYARDEKTWADALDRIVGVLESIAEEGRADD